MTKFDIGKNNTLLLIVYLTYGALLLPSLAVNYALAILFAFCLFVFTKKRQFQELSWTRPQLILIFFYFLHIAGLFYSENSEQGSFDLEKKLSLLLIPVLTAPLLAQFTPSHFHKFRLGVGLISLFSSIVFLILAAFKYYVQENKDAFNFETFIPYNYVYYSFYFSFSVLGETKVSRFWKFTLLFLLPTYSIGVLTIVSSKMGIISFLLGYITFLVFKVKNYKLIAAGFLSASLITFIFISSNPTTLDRFIDLKEKTEIIEKDKFSYDEPFTGLTLRLTFWKIAINHMVEDKVYLFGTGTGDSQDYMNRVYKIHNLDAGGYEGFNPHNQWVQTFLQLGLMGVLALASVFISGIISSLKNKNFALTLFLITAFCFTLSESIFEVNKGIVFFSLFFTILVSQKKTTVERYC
jgi:O-antigen ligase